MITHAELWARRALSPDAPDWDFPVGADGHIVVQPTQIIPLNARQVFISLQWALDDLSANSYSLAVHLLDSSGQLVGQLDRGLDAQAFGCSAQIIDLNGSPGSLIVRAGVYNWQTGDRLYPTGQSDWAQVATLQMPP